jgi:hypothetical protein
MNHVSNIIGENTYFNSGYCTAIVCLSPTNTDVIA